MSPQKRAAQISNSAASTGPRSQEGKFQSSQNRVVHGLCSKKFKIAPNERPEFEHHYNALLAELAPIGAVESQLAEAIVIDLWRMSRARQLENEIFVQGAEKAKDAFFAAAETWTARCKELALLTLYSQRIHRVLIKNQADLAALQSKRVAQAGHPLGPPAQTVATSAEPPDSKPATSAPSQVGFVHSSPAAESATTHLNPADTRPNPHSTPPTRSLEAQIAA